MVLQLKSSLTQLEVLRVTNTTLGSSRRASLPRESDEHHVGFFVRSLERGIRLFDPERKTGRERQTERPTDREKETYIYIIPLYVYI
jgi:hypothetical protein